MTAKTPALYVSSKGTGPELVLVHGWGTHSGVWQQTVDLLCTDFRVIVVDLPGYARSSKAYKNVAPKKAFECMCEQVNDAIEKPAIWVGWSMGGLLATGIALKYPDKVKQLILVASTPRFTSDTDWRAMESETFEQFAEQLQQDYESTLKRFMLLQTRNSENSGTALKLLRQQWQQVKAPSRAVLETGLNILQNTDLRSQLSKLQCPVSFIYGQLDTLARPGLLDSMKKYHSKFNSIVIEKAAHAPFLSHPQLFKEQLMQLIVNRGVSR